MTAGGARGRRLRILAKGSKIMPMINQLIWLVVVAFILSIIWWVADWLGLPQPINKIVKAVILLVGVIFLIDFLLRLAGQGGIIRM